MDNKKIAILGIIVILVVAACGGYFLLKDDSHSNDSDKKGTDFTLLDSSDKIVKGLTVKDTYSHDDYSYNKVWVVDSVADGKVTYTMTKDSTEKHRYDISYYGPGEDEFGFDYSDADDIPETVTVTHTASDDTYTISGTWTEMTGTVRTYENIVIVCDGDSATSVTGKMTTHDEKKGTVLDISYEYSTDGTDVVVLEKGNQTINYTVNASDYYSLVFEVYDVEYYKPIATESTETVGNVTATLYTLNGDKSSDNFENYKIYTYNGYVIKQSGLYDHKQCENTLDIYIA